MTHHDHVNSSCRQGFTLIEMMIAIALGAMVIYVAVAGFRAASQSITVVNRLAIENALIRSGMQVAHEHLDFWTDCDVPTSTNLADRRLRGKDAVGGMPFTPMRDVFPYVPNNANPELSTGWNPRETWSAHDPRQWWRGNQAEHDQVTVHIAGRYARLRMAR
jgi:prepilin-type N-terminal cleavage/methylation domain-containing protein